MFFQENHKVFKTIRIADFLGYFTCFKAVIPRCLEALTKCVSDSPWQVMMQQLLINIYMRHKLISFGMISLKWDKLEHLVLDWKAILKKHYGRWFLINVHSCFLTNSKTLSGCFWLTVSWIALVTKFLKKLFYASINKLDRISINFKNWL